MNTIKSYLLFLFLIFLAVSLYAQDNLNTPQRTPEQEATKQTEKLQQELNLSTNQAKQVYEINLKYARERQVSNTRTQAMERMKYKNAEIDQVLSPNQSSKLQSMRYDRSTIQNQGQTQLPLNTTGFRSYQENKSNSISRFPSSIDVNNRSTFRPVRPNYNHEIQPNNNFQRSNPHYSQPATNQKPTRIQPPPPVQTKPASRRPEIPAPQKTDIPQRPNMK